MSRATGGRQSWVTGVLCRKTVAMSRQYFLVVSICIHDQCWTCMIAWRFRILLSKMEVPFITSVCLQNLNSISHLPLDILVKYLVFSHSLCIFNRNKMGLAQCEPDSKISYKGQKEDGVQNIIRDLSGKSIWLWKLREFLKIPPCDRNYRNVIIAKKETIP